MAALSAVAICNRVEANSLEKIDNPRLHAYSAAELDRGAPSLGVTARVLYREALDTLKKGDWRAAREKLQTASVLSPDYADPLFTLARIELVHGHPDFLYHLFKGFKCQIATFRRQALLAANTAVFLACISVMALVSLLVLLLVKYWQMLDHTIRESYSSRFSFPPAGFITVMILIAAIIMRAGFAIYISLMMIALWVFLTRKEKGAVIFLVAVVSALSFLSPYSNVLVPGIDEDSTTRRLALINEKGADDRLIAEISEIQDPSFRAEKEYALGTLLYRLGRLDEARDHLLASVSARGDFAPAYLNLGNVYFMKSEYNKALAGYQNVLAIDSTNAVAHFNVGQAYINMMLFAQSSSALKRARDHGIESFRETHPAIALRNLPIYESGFSAGELWSAAWKESRSRHTMLFDEILAPWILFPFRWLGYLLAASLAAAVITAARISRGWSIALCDNCGRVTCSKCSYEDPDLVLCGDCWGVIKGLASVKVMEALLRHRRQKVAAERNAGEKVRSLLFPGASGILTGKTFSGMVLMLTSLAAVLLFAWRGSFFKDPYILNTSTPLWKIITPLAVIAAGYALSALVRKPQAQRNYRILRPDFSLPAAEEEKAAPRAKAPGRTVDRTQDEKFEEFLNSL